MTSAADNKPRIIFDTDMDTDCDDAGAIAMLLNAHNEGKIDLLGIIASAPSRDAAPCSEVICEYYGVKVPVGAVYYSDFCDDPRFADYMVHQGNCTRLYNKILSKRIAKCDRDYESAAKVYRKLLSEAQDKSITLVCVGTLTALAALLESGGDEISPLNGIELVKNKVKFVVSMGSPEAKPPEKVCFNYRMDIIGAKKAFDICPVPVFISNAGTYIVTGKTLTGKLPKDHPLRVAYECWGGENRGRSSWDLIAALFALDPESDVFRKEKIGTVVIDSEDQSMVFMRDEKENYEIFLTISPAECEELLENMLC